jgi:hypothetical protein
MRDRRDVNGLLAGLGIDRRYNVLRHGFLVPQPLAVRAVKRLNDAELTGGHHRRTALAVDREVDQRPLIDRLDLGSVASTERRQWQVCTVSEGWIAAGSAAAPVPTHQGTVSPR